MLQVGDPRSEERKQNTEVRHLLQGSTMEGSDLIIYIHMTDKWASSFKELDKD